MAKRELELTQCEIELFAMTIYMQEMMLVMLNDKDAQKEHDSTIYEMYKDHPEVMKVINKIKGLREMEPSQLKSQALGILWIDDAQSR